LFENKNGDYIKVVNELNSSYDYNLQNDRASKSNTLKEKEEVQINKRELIKKTILKNIEKFKKKQVLIKYNIEN